MPKKERLLPRWKRKEGVTADHFDVIPLELVTDKKKLTFCRLYLSLGQDATEAYERTWPGEQDALKKANAILRDPLIHKCLDFLTLSPEETGFVGLKVKAQKGEGAAAKQLIEATEKRREGKEASHVWKELMIEAGAYVVKPLDKEVTFSVLADSVDVFDSLPSGAVIKEQQNGQYIIKMGGGLAVACPFALLVQGPKDYSEYVKNATELHEKLNKPYSWKVGSPPEGYEDLAMFADDEDIIDLD